MRSLLKKKASRDNSVDTTGNRSRISSRRQSSRLGKCCVSSIKKYQSLSKSRSKKEAAASFFESERNSFVKSNQKGKKPSNEGEEVRNLKEQLYLERKKNLDLQRKLEGFKKSNFTQDETEKKIKKIKADYKCVLEAFEKSEKIRRE